MPATIFFGGFFKNLKFLRIFLAIIMSVQDIDAMLCELRLQKRNLYKVLNDMLIKGGTDDGHI